MNRSDYSNSMEDQVFQLPSYMKQISDTVWEACRRVVTPEMKGLYAKHIMKMCIRDRSASFAF